jgi:hypothetical protein
MAFTSIQSDERTHPQEGAIYKDRSNNLIQLLSRGEGGYCLYVYLALANPRPSMHGSVTGLTRRDVFEADFVLVAGSVEDWITNQRKQPNKGNDGLHTHLLAVQAASLWRGLRDRPIRFGNVSRDTQREQFSRRRAS